MLHIHTLVGFDFSDKITSIHVNNRPTVGKESPQTRKLTFPTVSKRENRKSKMRLPGRIMPIKWAFFLFSCYLDLRSKSLTFGKVRISSTFLSPTRDFAII